MRRNGCATARSWQCHGGGTAISPACAAPSSSPSSSPARRSVSPSGLSTSCRRHAHNAGSELAHSTGAESELDHRRAPQAQPRAPITAHRVAQPCRCAGDSHSSNIPVRAMHGALHRYPKANPWGAPTFWTRVIMRSIRLDRVHDERERVLEGRTREQVTRRGLLVAAPVGCRDPRQRR